MKINKLKKNEKTREPKLHAIHNFPVGSFAVRDHLRSDLGIISGRGSFAVGDHLRRWSLTNGRGSWVVGRGSWVVGHG